MLVRFALIAALASAFGFFLSPFEQETPEQPIAYSHKVHIEQGLDCATCHTTAATHDQAQLPSVSKCMLCHAAIAVDHPEVQKLAAYAEQGVEPPWKRVYGFTQAAHVIFRHAAHANAGVECATCHGDLSQMTVAEPAVHHDMGTCLNCHRESGASEDCAACHY